MMTVTSGKYGWSTSYILRFLLWLSFSFLFPVVGFLFTSALRLLSFSDTSCISISSLFQGDLLKDENYL